MGSHALVLLGAASLLFAMQATQATVTGVVRGGAAGEPLVGAVVSLTDLNRSAITGSGGRYALREVPAGPQHLTIRFIGHAPRTLHALVPAGGDLEINVTLRLTPIRLAAVDVRPRVDVRGVDVGDSTTYPDRGATIAAVRNHPGLAEPDVLQALSGGHVVLAQEAPSGVHVRGGSSDQTAYMLDGIPVLSPYHAAGLFSAWNPDALDRLQLSSVAPSPGYPDALSGIIEATTRDPGDRLGAHGALSSTQARLTVDGPLGVGRASYLVSVRSGFPGPISGSRDPSYVRGETGDWLAKVIVPALGGQIRLLGYGSGNELTTAAQSDSGHAGDVAARRNAFDWYSRSLGVEWRGAIAGGVARVLAWSVRSDAGALWAPSGTPMELTAGRRDGGALALLEHRWDHGATTAGVRVERSHTVYRIMSDSGGWQLSGRTPITTAFAQHASEIGRQVHVELGASLAVTRAHERVSPRVRMQWMPTDRLALSGSYARLHQFAQSLRNGESVVSTVFPADLFVGVDAGLPVARSDQGVLSMDFRPFAGLRVGAQMYARTFDDVITSTPRDGEPFATGSFDVGRGSARGVSVDAALSTARTGVVASYGVQRVRLGNRDGRFVPEYGATQLLEGGVIVFPAPTWSIRLGATGAIGRRATPISNGVEWESCNLLDAGCEFTGSPRSDAQALGRAHLSAYARVDLGVRKHWHASVAGRELLVGAYGTITNVFDRRNILTYARSTSGEPFGVVMRPVAPLVAGLEWQF